MTTLRIASFPELTSLSRMENPLRAGADGGGTDIIEALRRDVLRRFSRANLDLAAGVKSGRRCLPFVRVPRARPLPWDPATGPESDTIFGEETASSASQRFEALGSLRRWLEGVQPEDDLVLLLRLVDEQFDRAAVAHQIGADRNELQRLLVDACLRVHRAALAEALLAGLRETPACAVEVCSLGVLEGVEPLYAVPLAGAECSFEARSSALLRGWLEDQSARLLRERSQPVYLVGAWGGPGEPLLTAAVAHVADAAAVRDLARSQRRSRVLDLCTGEPVAVAEFPYAMAA